MRRQRPIRSVLAGRKMFNGGMMMPLDTPPAMQNTPSGILASSQPLIESVTQEVVAPMSSASASAPVPMAQGGAVQGFRNGGMGSSLYSFPVHGGAVPDPNAMVPSLGPEGMTQLLTLRTETDSERLNRMFPGDSQVSTILAPGGSRGPSRFAQPSAVTKTLGLVPGRVGQALEATGGAADEIARFVNSFLARQFRGVKDVANFAFSDEEQRSGRSITERSVLTELISARPDLANEIMEASVGLLGTTNSAEEFSQEIAKSLSLMGESAAVDKAAGIELNRPLGTEDEIYDDIFKTPEPVQVTTPEIVSDDEEAFYTQDLNEEIRKYGAAMQSGPDSQMKFAQDLMARTDVTDRFKQSVLNSANVEGSTTEVVEEPTETAGSSEDYYDAPLTESVSEDPDVGKRNDTARFVKSVMGGLEKERDDEYIAANIEAEENIGIPVTDSGNPDKPPVMTQKSDLFSELTRRGPETDPDVVAAGVDSVISRGMRKTEGDNSVDVNKLKNDIEALMPVVSEDPATEGLLLMMLGASIAGGESPNWLANVKSGMEKSMPALINYKEKLRSDKRARQMSVAKMAISQKLSLEAEQRAETRAIRTGQRAEARTIRTEERAAERAKLKTKQYITIRPSEIDASSLTDGAEGKITIPRFMPMTLDSYGVDRLQKLNVPIIRVGEPTFKLEDIMGGAKKLDAKELNRNYTEPRSAPSAPFKLFGDDYSYRYMEPKYSAYLKAREAGLPDPKAIINPSEAQSLFKAYKRVSKNYGRMYQDLDELNQIAQKGRLVGTGAIKQQIGTALQGLSGARFLEGFGIKKFASILLGGADLSDRDSFTTKGRLLLAKMAPIILGESGRTISDADRIRVARSLGFEVDSEIVNGEQVFKGITGFDSRILQNPNTVMAAINETATLVRDRYEKIHDIYAQEMARFDVAVPGLRKFAPTKRTKTPTLRFDLRKKAQT